jgi:hypothetical protein
MNHFIYAMNADDPAPAAGGDTKSWFEYYKWDVGGHAYVPVPEAALIDYEFRSVDVVWFIMDGELLGCCHVDALHPSLNDKVELHYDTENMQVAPKGAYIAIPHATGRAPDAEPYNILKRLFDAQYPPRKDRVAAEDLQAAAT